MHDGCEVLGLRAGNDHDAALNGRRGVGLIPPEAAFEGEPVLGPLIAIDPDGVKRVKAFVRPRAQVIDAGVNAKILDRAPRSPRR